MDQNEYDRSKDIILDLLGWGVEPEYLAGTGLSREVIFYVFTELRLRLPQNLDITGLTPYYPAPPNSEIAPPITTSQPRPLTSSLSNTMPPPAVPPRHDAPRVTHPSLPQKPPGHAPTQLDVPVTVPVVEQERPQATAEANLHDIEQQRKQELIARKAVQASRRNKPPLSATASLDQPPSMTDDVLMANVVPTESVDDFLKSIGPMTEMDNDRLPSYSRDTVPYERDHESPEAMEVDDIPGFGDFSSTSSRVDTPPRSASSTGPADADINRSMTGDISSGSDRQHDENVRRGTKRPVASDFVDFEPGPQRSTHASSNGGAQPPSLRRKTTGSFASVSGMRRCVIDLSDSEDDGEGDAHHGESLRGSRQYSPVPTRASIPSGGNGSWNQQQHRSNGHRNQSPAELYAKEEEIKQMKELIAQREQSRLKKLATVRPIALHFQLHL
ncbi:hypothetical protein FIBSPDRAFT_306125 [Athelia psychrophila]|uniref:Uncharacterized protein n=1 Tax=Athelia psychrophila TaxID=1759441 RepID=A0A166W5S1_9AGAM|nr:hypothetical protein FIBSPDRAFT_306125 [Fibularhizoctonia sp. CBS 109695]